ncbi:hypothetical protein Pst134EA_019713 [Puccinia striiformis f. sp. tritici]|uniref:hypothetical protein n=1 Tax=Puccinia striiformis f. sp. tritici TaxID=168172 RepID=UPI002008863C|nr:hypothetical protein Pst134EA_019713 [Puccinia striiformis f. sp. tritici]KAH9459568.1 hypothetical protein Pst134EA_019713 [Puccinia striiformis f. sp. tritici]
MTALRLNLWVRACITLHNFLRARPADDSELFEREWTESSSPIPDESDDPVPGQNDLRRQAVFNECISSER